MASVSALFCLCFQSRHSWPGEPPHGPGLPTMLLFSPSVLSDLSRLEEHRVSSCVVVDGLGGGGGSGAGARRRRVGVVGVRVSSLDLDLLEHGLHGDEEVGLVNGGV